MEETVTVSGQSPVVDVQSNSKAQVLSREVLDAVPTAHTIQGVGQLVVGVTLTAPDVGGSQAMQQTYFTVHGLGAAQTSLMMDGMIINGLQGDGAIQTYTNDAGNQEMVYQTGGGTVGLADRRREDQHDPERGRQPLQRLALPGLRDAAQAAERQPDVVPARPTASRAVDKIGTYNDTNFTVGGPIKKDSLWFFGSGPLLHRQQADRQHLRVRRHQGRHPRLRQRAGRPRRHALPAGRRSDSISTAAWRASPGRSARATSCRATTTASTRSVARR